MANNRADAIAMRERSRSRVRKITRVTGVTASVTGFVLAGALAAQSVANRTSLTSAPSARSHASNDNDDASSWAPGQSSTTQSQQAPATHSGGS